VVEWRFCWGFCEFLLQNVVFSMVNCGEFVVKMWLETTANSSRKNTPNFLHIFSFFFTKGRHKNGVDTLRLPWRPPMGDRHISGLRRGYNWVGILIRQAVALSFL